MKKAAVAVVSLSMSDASAAGGALQRNAFALFDLPVQFEVDKAELERRYFSLQRTCHPDRLVGKSAVERQQAILRSMQANESHEILKNPYQRARHLLALQGIQVGGEQDAIKPTPALLMDVMEMREAVEEAATEASILSLEQQITQQVETLQGELSQAFAHRALAEAAQLVLRFAYLQKTQEEIRSKIRKIRASCGK